MTVEVDPQLVDRLSANTGAAAVRVVNADDPEALASGLRAAKAAIYRLPHPEEPEDPLPSFAAISEAGTDSVLRFDIADAEAYPGLVEQVVAAIASALNDAGVSGTLTAAEA